MKNVVGLTGGIGSGKTAAADRFSFHGVAVVEADRAARVIMEPGKPVLAAVAERFGERILLPDGKLDRARLRRLVFADPRERRWLERLTHPPIYREIVEQLAASSSVYSVLDSPLLLETAQNNLCECVVVVDIPEELQLRRAAARDENSERQIRRIMAAQMQREERLRRADHVLDNSGALESLHSQIDELHGELLRRYS